MAKLTNLWAYSDFSDFGGIVSSDRRSVGYAFDAARSELSVDIAEGQGEEFKAFTRLNARVKLSFYDELVLRASTFPHLLPDEYKRLHLDV